MASTRELESTAALQITQESVTQHNKGGRLLASISIHWFKGCNISLHGIFRKLLAILYNHQADTDIGFITTYGVFYLHLPLLFFADYFVCLLENV
jgi:hypothetical protein